MNKPEEPRPAGPDKPGATSVPGEPGAKLTLGKPATGTGSDLPDEAATTSSGKGLGAFVLILVAALLAGGGFWLAKATSDPSNSEEYVALASAEKLTAEKLDSVTSERDDVAKKLAGVEAGIEEREQAADAKVAGLDGREKAVKTSEEAITAKEEESAKKIAEREAAVKKREDAVTGVEQTKADNTVGAGIWTVGVDIEPGTYRANANVSADCYWAITVTGSNGSDIVNNGIPGGGRPSAVISVGHDFELVRCGTWSKQ